MNSKFHSLFPYKKGLVIETIDTRETQSITENEKYDHCGKINK